MTITHKEHAGHRGSGFSFVSLVSVVVIFAAAAIGCGRARSDRPRVALVLKTLNSPFFLDMRKGAEAAAQRLGVDLTVQAADREIDVEKQMQIIENLIETGVNALAICPSGSSEIVPAIGKANRAGIPVIIVDDRIDERAAAEAGVRFDTYTGSDNVEGGRIAGRYLVQATGGHAKIALLEGIPGHQTGDARLQGFREAIRTSPGISVVASQTANWERDQGFTVFRNMLQAHPDIDAVFACNDVMALGAVEAIEAAGRSGEIRVIGFDAIDDAKRAIESGAMDASVAQFPAEMGRIAIESAAKLIRHEPVERDQPTKVELVTRQNVGK
jgi:ribose transport system substrate-binding protein